MEDNEIKAQIAVGTASLLDRLKALAQESFFTDAFEQAKNKRTVYQAVYNPNTAMIEITKYLISSIMINPLMDKNRYPQIKIHVEAVHDDGNTHSVGGEHYLSEFFSTVKAAKEYEAKRLQAAAQEILKDEE
jgi:hypothetical protein